jgi:hypothetical protein
MDRKKKYIVLTSEGITIAPNSSFSVSNMQVMGIIENVSSENEAILKLLKNNDWIMDAEYNVSEFVCFELV